MEAAPASVDPLTSFAQLRCKKCRTILANSQQVQDHQLGMGSVTFNHTKRTISYIKEQQRSAGIIEEETSIEDRPFYQFSSEATRTCSSLFLEPLDWMKGINNGSTEGKIMCPKCETKLGAYCWAGQPCSCGSWIAPAFSVVRSKIDVQMIK
ncbi:hypothetical protein HK096_006631 [Nowakowskiella sp. JEL0078]|nr:hypothetical protein HK096_006631 [Nowakowskiella sp. JEL0078]